MTAPANSPALVTFAGVFSDDMLALRLGPKLTCYEAEALADALTALGQPDAARTWMEAHGASDEPDDRHYRQAGVTP